MADVEYVITARAIRNGAFVADVGSVRYLRVPADVAVPTPEMGTTSQSDINKWVAEVRALADSAPNSNSISVAGDVLIFVHGTTMICRLSCNGRGNWQRI